MKRQIDPRLRTAALVVFLAGGLLLVRAGALPLWVWLLLTALTIAMRLLPRLDPYVDQLELTGEGLKRQHGSRLRRQAVEQLRWEELTRVEVLTHETGPDAQDMLFLLFGSGSNGVAVPGTLARQHGLAAVLQQRLPGFRAEELAAAEATAGRASFVLWERVPQDRVA